MPKSTSKNGNISRKTYLDYAASVEANPSSIHALGLEVRKKLEDARTKVAGVLGARPAEIIFTSGGTESNNLAIQGTVLSFLEKNSTKILPHIITTNIEHASVLETFKLLAKRKLAQISIVPVEANGIVDSRKIKKEIKRSTVLISVMYANNEIGTIQPIREIAKEVRHYKKQNNHSNLVFHTDAVQAVNYLDLNVERLGVDLLTLTGTKIDGAGRVGVLYKRKSAPLVNILGGGDQEMGLRPGTENVDAIVKFSKALEFAQKIKEKEVKREKELQEYFLRRLNRDFKGLIINGDLVNRLPNNINITIPNIPSDLLVIELSARGIMASSKSACKAGDGKSSHVIQAINPNLKDTDGSIRFSFGRDTQRKDIDYTLKSLSKIIEKLIVWY